MLSYANGLKVFKPDFTSVELVCGTMPSKADSSVVLICEAAYTEQLLDAFSHDNIDGPHVSEGIFYEGAPCRETEKKIGCTGAFAWYDGEWHYALGYDEGSQLLRTAAEHGGCGFSQAVIFYDGVEQKTTRGTREAALLKETWYRVLAVVDGRLCILESEQSESYGAFLTHLREMKPTFAIYLDMGHGWNYSWYRDNGGHVRTIHPMPGRYTTNWITFINQ